MRDSSGVVQLTSVSGVLERNLKKLMPLYALMSCWTLVIGLVSNLKAYTCRFDTIVDWKIPFNGSWFNPVPQLVTFLDSSQCLMWDVFVFNVFYWKIQRIHFIGLDVEKKRQCMWLQLHSSSCNGSYTDFLEGLHINLFFCGSSKNVKSPMYVLCIFFHTMKVNGD